MHRILTSPFPPFVQYCTYLYTIIILIRAGTECDPDIAITLAIGSDDPLYNSLPLITVITKAFRPNGR